MAMNIEIKARVRDSDQLRGRAAALSGSAGEVLQQEDIFFNVPVGRLKLRTQSPEAGQLIFYQRNDIAGPKSSHYHIFSTTNPAGLQAVLAQSLGVRGVVRKQRWLFLVGQTRIHLDEVVGLGNFMELEVVLRDGQPAGEGIAIAQDLMKQLGIRADDLITGAYIDLISTPQQNGEG